MASSGLVVKIKFQKGGGFGRFFEDSEVFGGPFGDRFGGRFSSLRLLVLLPLIVLPLILLQAAFTGTFSKSSR